MSRQRKRKGLIRDRDGMKMPPGSSEGQAPSNADQLPGEDRLGVSNGKQSRRNSAALGGGAQVAHPAPSCAPRLQSRKGMRTRGNWQFSALCRWTVSSCLAPLTKWPAHRPHLVADVDIARQAGDVLQEPRSGARRSARAQPRGGRLALAHGHGADAEIGIAALAGTPDVDDGDVGLQRWQSHEGMCEAPSYAYYATSCTLQLFFYPNYPGVGARGSFDGVELPIGTVCEFPQIQHRLAAGARLGAHVACGTCAQGIEQCNAHEHGRANVGQNLGSCALAPQGNRLPPSPW